MNRDEIIRLAREAGFPPHIIEAGAGRELERFAALVAANEREACAKVCDEHKDEAMYWCAEAVPGDFFAAAIRARGT